MRCLRPPLTGSAHGISTLLLYTVALTASMFPAHDVGAVHLVCRAQPRMTPIISDCRPRARRPALTWSLQSPGEGGLSGSAMRDGRPRCVAGCHLVDLAAVAALDPLIAIFHRLAVGTGFFPARHEPPHSCRRRARRVAARWKPLPYPSPWGTTHDRSPPGWRSALFVAVIQLGAGTGSSDCSRYRRPRCCGRGRLLTCCLPRPGAR
jgi:hypothetical protein